ncbi:MAG: two-component sensor histidine kinase [Cryomorphaceae bacterium MED-G14]|nr:MAG: two-component sensor histidine kinase [Cryomorphaceae bacterium MED-G14]|tara:strand:+ start:124 stop:1548 length:1425 start_codon:yes stop_codon:yes gene_type:complete
MKKPFFYLRTRIFLSMIALVFVSFLLIGLSTNFQITESSYYYHELRLDRKESQLQRAISYEFINNINPVKSQIFRDKIFKISDIQNISFSIYDLNGNLIQSTFEESALSRISQDLIDKINLAEKKKYVEIKKVGEKQVRESYSIIYDYNNEPIWILNLPYFDDDKLNVYELRSFILNIVQVYLLLFVLAIIISYFVSSYITNPISEIVYKMKQMRIDKLNKKINLKVTSREMFTLVNSYNNMVDQIDQNIKEISKSQRELAWREMAKQVAHEIKNPLTPMKLSVQNFKIKFDPKDPNVEKKLDEYSKTLIQQIDVLSSIATAFSSFAELPAQKNEKIDLISTTKLCLEIFNDRNVVFKSDLNKLEILFDRTNLIRIINNLVKNSIQATNDILEPKILVQVKKINKSALIEIIDNGLGIPNELKEKIFEPNFTTKTKGMGLGLSIIKNLITNYKGTISFKSKKGETVFTIKLPVD